MTRSDLEAAKSDLKVYFDENYPEEAESSNTADPATTAPPVRADFTARYTKKVRKVKDELDELWRTEPALWTTDPVKWWAERRATYPRASRMAHDIFSIPGTCMCPEECLSCR